MSESQTGDFAADYKRMVSEIRAFALKHDLPLPTIVCAPQWRDGIARAVQHPVQSRHMVYFGVRFKFGRFYEGEIFQ